MKGVGCYHFSRRECYQMTLRVIHPFNLSGILGDIAFIHKNIPTGIDRTAVPARVTVLGAVFVTAKQS